jgi:hypothetical protein
MPPGLGNLSDDVLARILGQASRMRTATRQAEIDFMKALIKDIDESNFPVVLPPGAPHGHRRSTPVRNVVVIKRHGTQPEFRDLLLAGKTPAVFILQRQTYSVFGLRDLQATPQGLGGTWHLRSNQVTALDEALAQAAEMVLETRPLDFAVVHAVRTQQTQGRLRAVSGHLRLQFWAAAAQTFKRVVKRVSGWA